MATWRSHYNTAAGLRPAFRSWKAQAAYLHYRESSLGYHRPAPEQPAVLYSTTVVISSYLHPTESFP
ncbi:MAG: hypothetical protein H6564_17395 [Lewinellaceae bacterium]|nr:hypothetical protein [Lewinellaceae bacterium]